MKDNIIGFYASFTTSSTASEEDKKKDEENIAQFRSWIWGANGLTKNFEDLSFDNYGQDLKKILIQFEVSPSESAPEGFQVVEAYRRKERAIGLWVLVNNENFFNCSDEEKWRFLEQSITHCLNELEATVKNKGLDTNLHKLKSDVAAAFAAARN